MDEPDYGRGIAQVFSEIERGSVFDEFDYGLNEEAYTGEEGEGD